MLFAFKFKILPDSASDLSLVLCEVDVLKDLFLAVTHIVFVIFIAQVTSVALAIVKRRASIFRVVLKFFVDHYF